MNKPKRKQPRGHRIVVSYLAERVVVFEESEWDLRDRCLVLTTPLKHPVFIPTEIISSFSVEEY